MKSGYFAVVAIVLWACGLFAQSNLDSGLVAYWPFDGNANDESGNGNNGLVFGPTLTMDRFGNDSSAYEFDGIDNFIAYPTLWSGSPDALTMAAWFYYAPTQAEGKILYHGDNGEFQLLAVGDTAVGAVHLSSGWYFSYAAIVPDTWYFLVGVWKQGENLRLYLDGTLMDSVIVPNEPLLDVGTNYMPSIGSYSRTIAYYFMGKIDDIRIYNRSLTDLEIDSLFNEGVTSINEDGLETPQGFKLHQNFPNPFNPTTTLRFQIANLGFVSLKVYDALGREVATLIDEVLKPSAYTAEWDAADYSSGIYYYRLMTGHFVQTRKMVLLR